MNYLDNIHAGPREFTIAIKYNSQKKRDLNYSMYKFMCTV